MEQHPNMKYDLSFLDNEVYKAVEPFPERKPLPPFQQRFLALLLENQSVKTTCRLLEFDPHRGYGVTKCLSRKNWIRIYHVYPERAGTKCSPVHVSASEGEADRIIKEV